jgi:hypothetical protein
MGFAQGYPPDGNRGFTAPISEVGPLLFTSAYAPDPVPLTVR